MQMKFNFRVGWLRFESRPKLGVPRRLPPSTSYHQPAGPPQTHVAVAPLGRLGKCAGFSSSSQLQISTAGDDSSIMRRLKRALRLRLGSDASAPGALESVGQIPDGCAQDHAEPTATPPPSSSVPSSDPITSSSSSSQSAGLGPFRMPTASPSRSKSTRSSVGAVTLRPPTSRVLPRMLSSPAGTGKTAIAGSVADTCEREGLLVASIFFSSYSGSADRCSKLGLITSIAYQLAEHESLQPFRTSLLERIDRRPSIFGKRLKAQAVGLLTKPLRGSRGRLDLSILPKAVIVDDLDEVRAAPMNLLEEQDSRRQDEQDLLEILSVLMELATSEHFPFRIIVSSRPERSI
ncbi:hypothetical protein NMY22_g10926 [Coprinellus aureogranulatus]|nr:hypothetical protein NMY22_g10926 [Coprinellus aureogranulatus]